MVESSIGKQFNALEDAAKVFDDWKLRTDTAVEELRGEMGALHKTVHRVVLDAGAASSAGILPCPEAAVVTSPISNPAVSPYGHRIES